MGGNWVRWFLSCKMLTLHSSSGVILISGGGIDLRTSQGHDLAQESENSRKWGRVHTSGWPSCTASFPALHNLPGDRTQKLTGACMRWERHHLTAQEAPMLTPLPAAEAEILQPKCLCYLALVPASTPTGVGTGDENGKGQRLN